MNRKFIGLSLIHDISDPFSTTQFHEHNFSFFFCHVSLLLHFSYDVFFFFSCLAKAIGTFTRANHEPSPPHTYTRSLVGVHTYTFTRSTIQCIQTESVHFIQQQHPIRSISMYTHQRRQRKIKRKKKKNEKPRKKSLSI